MSQMQYTRVGDGQGKYTYQCMAPSQGSLSHCSVRYTSPQADGGGGSKVEFLDRQHVSCGSNEVLQAFGIERIDGDKLRYKFTCCRVPGGSDAAYQARKQAAIDRNNAEMARLEGVITAAQAVQATSKTLYEEQAANRAAHLAVLQPLMQVSTEDGISLLLHFLDMPVCVCVCVCACLKTRQRQGTLRRSTQVLTGTLLVVCARA
jgi:hypothetical protein